MPLQETPVTLIISVYKDTESLACILDALAQQTLAVDEIIISEDGQDSKMSDFILHKKTKWKNLAHLAQKDNGFRKNRALNRAISAARNDLLIFIDGDCIPHRHFINAHVKHSKPGIVCAGRRVELGLSLSEKIRYGIINITRYNSNFKYLSSFIQHISDKTKNFEYGFYFPLLQKFSLSRPINLLGCNFSCFKKDLVAINGFNEDYKSPGIGEDSDIEWRLRENGISVKNIKFTAIQYHLYHPRTYTVSTENKKILNLTKEKNEYICQHGIEQHTSI